MRGGTLGEAIAIYVSDASLNQAEVEEAIEGAPLHARATPEIEQTRRPVQYLGLVDVNNPLSLDLGNRLPMFREAVGYQFWAYNLSGDTQTTGATVSGQVWTYGRFKD